MRTRPIADTAAAVGLLRKEIGKSEQSRYHHRLHAVLLVVQGMSCRRAGQLLEASPRTVASWVQRFEQHGLQGLLTHRKMGRPSRLSERQIESIRRSVGLPVDGPALSGWIEREYGIRLGVRQCQRLLRQLAVQRNNSTVFP